MLPERVPAAVRRRLRHAEPGQHGADHRADLLDGDRAHRACADPGAGDRRLHRRRRAAGAPAWRIVVRQILPNTLAPIVVAATLNVARAILLEILRQLPRLRHPAADAELGQHAEQRAGISRSTPWLAIVPGLAITLAVTSFNFVGDGLRDALDPRLRDA